MSRALRNCKRTTWGLSRFSRSENGTVPFQDWEVISLRLPKTAVLLVCWMGIALVGGCGPPNPQGRLAVSGKVTFQGEPLDQGTIQFTPLDRESGVSTGAMIRDGSYRVEAHRGLLPGKYRVRIFSAEAKAEGRVPKAPGMPAAVPKERIPARYNIKSTLEAPVTKDGENEFDFDLE